MKAWIVNAPSRIKSHLRHCETCVKAKARPLNQEMASLPPYRVTPPTVAFAKSGLDYAGPIKLHKSKGRGVATDKGYILLFVCMASKAMHIEVVGDQTTDSFLGALERFISHRGMVTEIRSDNGSTFHGADSDLHSLLVEAKPTFHAAPRFLATKGITWRFIPLKAPHFGGLWEAGIKSAKTLSKKIFGQRILTYEEMSTLTARVEIALNCRILRCGAIQTIWRH